MVTGSTGLVGRGALQAGLVHPAVTSVTSVTRGAVGFTHPKLTEHLHDDFAGLGAVKADLEGLDACFWCLGSSAMGLSEATYRTVTADYTLEATRRFARRAPALHFCFVSGAGADAGERSRAIWARVKGHA